MKPKNTIHITLISPYHNITANGLRIISAYLKQQGHDVDLVFLKIPNNVRHSEVLHEQAMLDLINLCQSSDLIGFSLMTNHFLLVKNLTQRIKAQLEIPIIWGGIHPTVKPEECLEYADIVCIGEGEEAILELADKLASQDDITAIQNLWFKRDNSLIKNEVRNLEDNLDKYPFQDYDITTQYILKGTRIVKMTEQLLEEAMPKNTELGHAEVEYFIITTRNCPHNCTYCCNNAYRKIYQGKGKFVRKRSPENIIKELETIKNTFGFIKQVLITDDTFFIRTQEEMETFCTAYRQRIQLPLRCYASPLTLTEEKLQLMLEAGLYRISMGIQSYSEETLFNIYKRPTPQRMILDKIHIIDKYKAHIPRPAYHIIVDNPYETQQAKKETLQFVASLPPGTRIGLFPLVFYPGTELYENGLKDGILQEQVSDIYQKFWTADDVKNVDYITHILYLYRDLHTFTLKYNLKLPIQKIMQILSRDEFIFVGNNRVVLALIALFKKMLGFPAAIRGYASHEMRFFIRKTKKKGLKIALKSTFQRHWRKSY